MCIADLIWSKWQVVVEYVLKIKYVLKTDMAMLDICIHSHMYYSSQTGFQTTYTTIHAQKMH